MYLAVCMHIVQSDLCNHMAILDGLVIVGRNCSTTAVPLDPQPMAASKPSMMLLPVILLYSMFTCCFAFSPAFHRQTGCIVNELFCWVTGRVVDSELGFIIVDGPCDLDEFHKKAR